MSSMLHSVEGLGDRTFQVALYLDCFAESLAFLFVEELSSFVKYALPKFSL